MRLFAPLIEWLFPPVCPGCGEPVPADLFLCDKCKKNALENLPERAGQSVSDVFLPDGMLFQDACWKFRKGQLIQDLLHNIKYGGYSRLAVELGRSLGARIAQAEELSGSIVLVPVPLHPKRLRKRGYNQAEEIARGIAETTGWPLIDPNLVRRTRYTQTQTGFSMDERQKNIANAFETVDMPEKFETAVLIDDVFTTGATIFELHRAVIGRVALQTAIATLAVA